jgi:glyoxylase-like metal-dependent hydrolase (beta-lactamase superfamily II)
MSMLTEILPALYTVMPARPTPNTPITYLLRRSEGNVLLATKADVSDAAEAIAELGGIAQVLLGDRHHAQPHIQAFAERFGAVLCCSTIEAAVLKKHNVEVARALPYRATTLAPDLEILPTPGHTAGAFSYLWSHEGRRYLFIGDTLVPVDGEWRFWVTTPNRAKMRETVRRLSALKFDVILSNSFAAAPSPWVEMKARDRAAMVSALEKALV